MFGKYYSLRSGLQQTHGGTDMLRMAPTWPGVVSSSAIALDRYCRTPVSLQTPFTVNSLMIRAKGHQRSYALGVRQSTDL